MIILCAFIGRWVENELFYYVNGHCLSSRSLGYHRSTSCLRAVQQLTALASVASAAQIVIYRPSWQQECSRLKLSACPPTRLNSTQLLPNASWVELSLIDLPESNWLDFRAAAGFFCLTAAGHQASVRRHRRRRYDGVSCHRGLRGLRGFVFPIRHET